jgi:hypothetical protein
MDEQTADDSFPHALARHAHHLDHHREHLFLPKSPPRRALNGLCKAVLPPSPVSEI